MIGLARLYCRLDQEFMLVDVPRHEARFKHEELTKLGWVVYHTELV